MTDEIQKLEGEIKTDTSDIWAWFYKHVTELDQEAVDEFHKLFGKTILKVPTGESVSAAATPETIAGSDTVVS